MSPTSSQHSSVSNVLSGALGGLLVLLVGAGLIATDVIETGDTTREVVERPGPSTRPVASGAGGVDRRTVSDIYKQEGPGVVFIQARGTSSESPFGPPGERGGTATGSGFVVDKEGTVITNAHVVEGSQNVSARFEEEGEFVDAKVVGRDPSTDIAVLKIDPDKAKLQPIPLGKSSEVEVGDPVVAIGNPFGFTRTVTTGIVSALQRQIEAPNGFPIRNIIQTDASINPGNSGGPLLDADGKVIGINSQIATGGSRGSVGIGFAVPIDTAKSLLPRLKRDGKVERSYLGIEMARVTEKVAEDLNLPVKEGALVTSVVSGGPADDAGLKGGRTPTGEGIVAGGDLIVKVDGTAVKTPDDVAAAIADDKPGDKIEIEYYRGKDEKTAEVELGKRPTALEQSRQAPREDGGGGLFP
ncbi:MAG: trypsin-like peptidase domain-containing protein [Thermoleophilaceae bacterium]|nr:trypsin-like peptidase domain-containing protein [Thermoleophilaceae bacterium]